MFPKLKRKLENSSEFIDGYQSLIGVELLEHFEELRSSEIYGVDLRDNKPLGELRYITSCCPKSKWFRFRGKLYIYSISLDTPDPEGIKKYIIFGYDNECKFSHETRLCIYSLK